MRMIPASEADGDGGHAARQQQVGVRAALLEERSDPHGLDGRGRHLGQIVLARDCAGRPVADDRDRKLRNFLRAIFVDDPHDLGFQGGQGSGVLAAQVQVEVGFGRQRIDRMAARNQANVECGSR